MKILETIKKEKIKEVNSKKEIYPIKFLEKSIYFESPIVSLKSYLNDKNRSGIIAEFKRKSPSKGNINIYADIEKVSVGYMQNGAAALSILTDEIFFGAKKDDLSIARKFNYCPILRKDFIVDEYQIIESKSIGADAILLIAKMLSPNEIQNFIEVAHSLKLEVLLETHSEHEIKEHLETKAEMIGINNRNLNSFEVSLENSIRLCELLPKHILKIAESGIDSKQKFDLLKKNGFEGFLIGEMFMKNSQPEIKCKEFIKSLSL